MLLLCHVDLSIFTRSLYRSPTLPLSSPFSRSLVSCSLTHTNAHSKYTHWAHTQSQGDVASLLLGPQILLWKSDFSPVTNYHTHNPILGTLVKSSCKLKCEKYDQTMTTRLNSPWALTSPASSVALYDVSPQTYFRWPAHSLHFKMCQLY